MNETFYPGDLVKIINISNEQIEILFFESRQRLNIHNIIGQMYYVERVVIDKKEKYKLQGWNHCSTNLSFETTQLQLIKRNNLQNEKI